jgi:C_GCAxxG_C_C family probable redox protein
MLLQKKKLAAQAVDLFRNGFYCSEAILHVFNEELNLGLNDAAIKMSTGFGAGLGASKCCCGSLTGAVLVLSAVKGRTSTEKDVDEVFILTQELHDKFKQRFRATCCRILTQSVKWGQPEHHKNCEKFVGGAVEILVDILNKSSKISTLSAVQKNA